MAEIDPQNGGSSSEGRRRGGGGRRAPNPVDITSPPVAPCGACKFLRRKCATDCIFAPYFTSDQAEFAAVHKIFGASNVSKLLLHMPVNRRQEAVVTICYEAQARLADPVYGCVSTIFALQQQVASLQAELASVQTQLMNNRYVVANTLHNTTEPPPPPPPQLPLGQLQPQHNQQSLPATVATMLQQQPAFSTNSSTSNNNNLINNFNNPSFDFMAAANNGASPCPNLGFSGRQSLELEDEEDIANFVDDIFRHRR